MQQDSQHAGTADTGVLMVNLGTPEAPTTPAVRKFLAEFLGDPRVIDLPRWIWLPILYLVILVIRPPRSARAYRKVWTDEGSPLMVISKKQRAALEQALDQQGTGMPVALGMRYGRPSVQKALQELRDRGVSRVVVLPMYPQFSGTTTSSIQDALQLALSSMDWQPGIEFIDDYHAEPGYIDALAKSITSHWQAHGRSEKLLLSFHGIPKRYADAGDPYPDHCSATAALLAERLDLDDKRWAMSYQSRVGREEWLRPYTDMLLEDWAKNGVQSVDAVCPGFSADCLETLEEIAMENQESFIEAGGDTLRYIAALNDRDEHIRFLADLVTQHAS